MRRLVLILVTAVVLIAAIVGVILVVLYATGGEQPSEPTPTPTPMPNTTYMTTPTPTCEPGVICVTAEQLCDDYSKNDIAADAKYKGKTLDVSGKIKEIDRGFTGGAFITLDCGLVTRVWCYFDKAHESEMTQVVEGDYVVVRGEGAGEALLDLLDQPKLEHCTSVIVTAPADGDGGWCFIATAAYGSHMDSNVDVLRQFRDSYLMTNPTGRGLVSVYYKLSPPVAQFIDDHPSSKPVVRAWLWPAVAMSTVAVNTTLIQKVAIVAPATTSSIASLTESGRVMSSHRVTAFTPRPLTLFQLTLKAIRILFPIGLMATVSSTYRS